MSPKSSIAHSPAASHGAFTLPGQRLHALDALRGVAMVWMTVFHLCFDLNHFGWIRQDFYNDPVWTGQRTAIVSLFLLCAGMGQAQALREGLGWARFWRRWGQVAGCALLVTVGSLLMYPRSFIYFGVLHGLAAMLLLARWAGPMSLRWPALSLLLAAMAVASPPWVAAWLGAHPWVAEWLDSRWLNWLGWITHKPVTEDYVPLFPWLGVLWLGLLTAQHPAVQRWAARPGVMQLIGPGGGAHPLARLGRWSLVYYMVHQPVMIGVLMAVQAVR